MPNSLDLSGFASTLVDRGLQGLPVAEQVDAFCRDVTFAGFPARRFNMSIGTLHPRHGAHSYVWRRDEGLATELHPRRRSDEENTGYLRSPIYRLRNTEETTLRRRLDTSAPDEFPILTELREGGMTDYAARLVSFGDAHRGNLAQLFDPKRNRPDPIQGIFFSCATDVPEGFDDDQLRDVGALLPYLALAVKSRSTFDVAQTLLETYLGTDAGGRVLTGEIDRHSVRNIQAVIWFCDLRGFSRMASRISQGALVELLDTYLELMARPVLDNRGQILKFMGDGFLATFDLSKRSRQMVCADAVKAARELVAHVPKFNASRRATGKETLEFGVAIHMGEVLYGNIGTRERLDFTVVGSAVNEASRIEGLCRPLGRHVLVSSAVHDAAAPANGALLSLGVHALRGIGEPQELFTIADA
ncbi:MAG TPA: adenylate/guanylate cyclase domain-containing protein [Casimicrobiaceae bacterium]|nr:adenylate/guanylate cyclase domain-containing protein [Casimicrobiaceae bacterium]